MSKTLYSKEYKDIIEKLKKARLKADLTQIQVSRLLNRPQSYVSKIESGERKIDALEIKRFAEIYKKKINFFY